MSHGIWDTDMERSWIAYLVQAMGPEKTDLEGEDPGTIERPPMDLPGMVFRVRASWLWVEPRLVAVRPSESSLRSPIIPVTLRVRCFVKIEAKGYPIPYALSELVDKVRGAIDPRFGCRPIPITNRDGERVGTLQFGPPDEQRLYNQQMTVRGDNIPGLDVAVLTIPAVLSPELC